MNDWIDEKTFGIIKNMIDDKIVQDPSAKMVLINTLAIDMEWQSQFDSHNTLGMNFTKADGTEIVATTMSQELFGNSTSTYQDEEITAVSLNLKQYNPETDKKNVISNYPTPNFNYTQLEFIAIQPSTSLDNFISNLDANKIKEITNKLVPVSSQKGKTINLRIPRFKFNYSLKLKEDLKALGMKEAFDDILADFTNMTNNPAGLYVSEALHKADIDFSEAGVKAAAVTVFAMYDKASMDLRKPVNITFDKPFLFLIRDKKTGVIWFVGTVYEPNLWEDDKVKYQKSYLY